MWSNIKQVSLLIFLPKPPIVSNNNQRTMNPVNRKTDYMDVLGVYTEQLAGASYRDKGHGRNTALDEKTHFREVQGVNKGA